MDFIIADTHYLSSRGLAAIICDNIPDARIYRITDSLSLIRCLSVTRGAIVIIDLSAFDFTDLDSFLRTASRFDDVHWVLPYPSVSRDALVAGVAAGMSILNLDGTKDDFTDGLGTIINGQNFICKEVLPLLDVHERPDTPDLLTPSEKEILRLISRGLSVKEMADVRCCSAHTIITHKKNIFRKLDVNTVHEAVKYALRSGLIELVDYYI